MLKALQLSPKLGGRLISGSTPEKDEREDGAAYWLAAYTRPRHEQQLRAFCEERGFEVFLPCYQTWRRWSDRKKLLTLPLFPSYVFLRVREAERRRAMQAPGFLWFVHNRLGPVRVEHGELEAIRQLLASGLDFNPLPNVEVGDEVEIIAGAMRGCRGRLLRKEMGAIALMVSAINGGVRVTLPDPSWITPLARGRGERLRLMGAPVPA